MNLRDEFVRAGRGFAGLGMLSVLMSGSAAATDEIIVTARYKEESLQEIPLAVTAIGEAELLSRGVKDVRGIVQLDPSVVFDQGFSAEDTRIAIRGLTNTRGRSNVAFLVDGVDVTSESGQTAGSSLLVSQRLLGDVERVEVVKGPQSALYGRAAFAGAISYVTKNASLDEVEGNFNLELADYNRYQLAAGIGGPLIEGKLGARVQAIGWDGDSFYDNATTGQNLGGSEGWGTALTVNWAPTDVFDLKWRISASEDDTGAPPQVVFRGSDLVEVPLPPAALAANGGPVADGTQVFSPLSLGDRGSKQVFASEDPFTGENYAGSSIEVLRSSLRANWEIGPGNLLMIGGFTNADLFITQDVDYQASGFPDTIRSNWEVDSRNRTEQRSLEVRYATSLDGPLNYTGGALLWRETRDFESRGYIVTCSANLDPLCPTENWQGIIRNADINYGDNGFFNAKTRHWSLYGMVEWQVSDRLLLSAEARYTDEFFDLTRSIDTPCLVVFAANPCRDVAPLTIAGSKRSDFITPKFLAEYTVNDATLVYASISKGQKPAGITTLNSGAAQSIEELSFESEKLWAYEAGWKTEFDGSAGNLVFNGAVFYQDYSDKQVLINRFDEVLGVIPSIENASSAKVFGQEIQLVYAPPVEGLTLTLGYTHLDTEYTDFAQTAQFAATIAEVGNCTQTQVQDDPNDPGSTRVECLVDRSGNELERSPEHALTSNLRWQQPLLDTGLEYSVEFDANYQSERFTNANSFTFIDDAWITNLRLGLSSDVWTAILFVDNLLDNDTIQSGGASAPDFGAGFQIPPNIQISSQLPDRRLVGLRVNYSFGD